MEYYQGCVVVLLSFCCLTVWSLPATIRLGGIFPQQVPISAEEKAFTFAVDKVNRDNDDNDTRLQLDIRLVQGNATFDATRTVCDQIENGVAAVFGAPSQDGALSIRAVCNTFEIPYIATQENGRAITEELTTINMYPNDYYISEALKDLVLHYGWKHVTIMYENEEGLNRLQGVLQASRRNMLDISVYRIPGPKMKSLLKDIKNAGANHIIVDCERDTLPLILEQMMEVQILRSYFHYLFTNLDLHLMNMSRYVGDKVNMSTIHLLNNKNTLVKKLMREWRTLHPQKTGVDDDLLSDPFYGKLTTQTAMIYDAVRLVDRALNDAFTSSRVEMQSLSCLDSHQKSWDYGLTVINYLKKAGRNESSEVMSKIDRNEIEDDSAYRNGLEKGITGRIAFDQTTGQRVSPFFHISELEESRFYQVGSWSEDRGEERLEMVAKDPEKPNKHFYVNRTLIVTTILEPPFLMDRVSENGEVYEGNDRYEGYCADLIKKIAELVNFEYELKLVADGNYGAPIEGTDQWNGMVGELMQRKADIAVAPLTITYAREKVIDFSKPYMYLGITILFRQPEPQNPGVFSFLNPLSFDVWLYVVLAFLLVSVTLFLLARFSPYEWYNEHPCNPEYDNVENQFTLPNCLWFSFGGLMQQGSEVNPRAFSTRVLSGFWWFFSLILISSYTANLAAFLTVERMVSPIQGADDMVKQTTIEYGTRNSGSTFTFFKQSKIPTYQKMWEYMSSRQSVFTQSYEEGINRVLNNRNYAFLMESTMAEYIISEHCKNLTQIGGLLNSRGYGIGLPLGSALRDEVTKVILQLQEDDTLLQLKNKWWKIDQCSNEEGNKEDANELGLKNIGGIFLVLISGLVCGMLAAVAEFIWKSRQNAEIDRKSLCAEMMSEMRFACRCHRNRRRSRASVQLDHKFLPSSPYPAGLNGQPIPIAETVA